MRVIKIKYMYLSGLFALFFIFVFVLSTWRQLDSHSLSLTCSHFSLDSSTLYSPPFAQFLYQCVLCLPHFTRRSFFLPSIMFSEHLVFSLTVETVHDYTTLGCEFFLQFLNIFHRVILRKLGNYQVKHGVSWV